ncbi:MAG: hypothetical protein IPP48_13245 [Chitinophagaceae bacterium]|nr:hypothetical protein [Chitinophagaceae bacterium]
MKKTVSLLLAAFLFCTNIFSQNAELPAITTQNAQTFFIPNATCIKYKLIAGNSDAWMKVYNNTAETATIQRVNDIRWQATAKTKAIEWYKNNAALLNEGAKDISGKLNPPVGVDAWNVYEANDEMQSMMEAMGIKQKQYTFTFVVDKIVAKIFIGANEKVTLAQAWQFAKHGLIATLKASGKTKLAQLVLKG